MFFISLLALFSSEWDFHMVCCCIKSNLTLLDQRLWWIPARCVHPLPFFSVLSGSKLDPQNWYVYLLNTEMFSSFFSFMNLWIALENLFYWNYFFPTYELSFMILGVIMSILIIENFDSIFTFGFCFEALRE
jgi:hypothetical protein